MARRRRCAHRIVAEHGRMSPAKAYRIALAERRCRMSRNGPPRSASDLPAGAYGLLDVLLVFTLRSRRWLPNGDAAA
jgi:hypothetical protein